MFKHFNFLTSFFFEISNSIFISIQGMLDTIFTKYLTTNTCSSYKDYLLRLITEIQQNSKDSASSIRFSLHQKYKDTTQFILILSVQLLLSSKHLAFLSFHTVHQIQAGIDLHHFFCLALPPALFQHFSIAVVDCGMTHFSPNMLEISATVVKSLCSVRTNDCYFQEFLRFRDSKLENSG